MILACTASLMGACALLDTRHADTPAPSTRLVAKDHRFAIVLPAPGDTLASLAAEFLGDETQAWVIADFNQLRHARPGEEVIIPLVEDNPLGVSREGYRKVAILSYHRIDHRNIKLSVSPERFERQMRFLRDHDFRVIPLRQVIDFLEGRRALPQRSVVITIDDGYRSAYQYAYPVLTQYRYPATIFVYTDFVGAPDALTWSQIREMSDSGLIEIQAHSKYHSNLAVRRPEETRQAYRGRVDEEIGDSIGAVERRAGTAVYSFAYPYGDTSEFVAGKLDARNVRLGLTVTAGGAPFYSDPLMLRRTMIFGDDDLERFRHKLDVFERAALP